MVTLAVSLLLLVAGCELLFGHRVTIPPSAQVGRIVISGETLTMDPTTVPAGDVYFEIEGSPHDLGWVTGSSEGWPPPALSNDDIARLARGGRQGFTFHYGMVGEDNILKFSGLLPGKYAFILNVDDAGPGDAPDAIAILTVLP